MLRMAQAPYRLGFLAFDDLPMKVKLDVADQFLQEPIECQSVFCRVLRQMYPTADLLVSKGALVMRTWMNATPTAIDFSERAHAQVRQLLSSDTSARKFEPIVAKTLCRNFAAEHVHRGGIDPTKLPLKVFPATTNWGHLGARVVEGSALRITRRGTHWHLCLLKPDMIESAGSVLVWPNGVLFLSNCPGR